MTTDGSGFCGRCGKPLPSPVARFCGYCGAEQKEKAARPTQNKKKWFLIGGAIAVALVVVFVAVVITQLNKPKTRTVMVYMIGSDLESSYAAASSDISEMLDAEIEQDDTKVLVYTGGSKKWAREEIDEKENAIFELKDGELVKAQAYEKKIMTKPETLTEFLDFAYENYKSNYYDLILWDHGGGPIMGYGSDENSLSGSSLSINDLSNALRESELYKKRGKLELIGFDACLMGSLEVATALSNYADYLIASEETEPGKGWSYLFLSDVKHDADIVEVSKRVIDEYIAEYDDYRYDVDLSLAAIDLAKVEKLASATEKLFDKINDEVTASTFSQYSRILAPKKVYGYTGRDNSSYDLVDLVDLASNANELYPGEVAEINNVAENAVIYSRTNMGHTNGLSMYFPVNNKKQVDSMLKKYEDVAFSDKYYDFLEKYASFITGSKYVTRSSYNDLDTKSDGPKAVSIELDDELANNYQKGEIMIFRKLGENKFVPIYRTSDVELNGKMLSASGMDLQFVIKATDENGDVEYGWVALYEKERTDDWTDYIATGLVGYEDKATSLGWSMKNQNTIIRVPNGEKNGAIREIRIINADESGLSDRIDAEQEGIMFLEYPVWTYQLYDENGQLFDSMVSNGEAFGTGINTKEGGKVEFVLTDLDFDFGDMYSGQISREAMKDYYAEFIVYDTQGEAHRLNLVHIN